MRTFKSVFKNRGKHARRSLVLFVLVISAKAHFLLLANGGFRVNIVNTRFHCVKIVQCSLSICQSIDRPIVGDKVSTFERQVEWKMSRSFASRAATTSEIGGKSQCGEVQVRYSNRWCKHSAQRAYMYPGAHVPFVKINSCDTGAAITMYLCARLKLLLLRVQLDIFCP